MYYPKTKALGLNTNLLNFANILSAGVRLGRYIVFLFIHFGRELKLTVYRVTGAVAVVVLIT